MTVHELKCWPEYFQPVLEHRKTVEIRRSDRSFAAGDVLLLREWYPQTKRYSGRTYRALVHRVEDLEPVGIPGFVAMELRFPIRVSCSPEGASDYDPRYLPQILVSRQEHLTILEAKGASEGAAGHPLTWAEFLLDALKVVS